MKWDIQTVGFKAKDDLMETVKAEVQKLEKFFQPIIGAEVYLKLHYDHADENKKVELKLNIPGEDLYSEHNSSTFEGSLKEAIDKMKRQLTKKKETERSHR